METTFSVLYAPCLWLRSEYEISVFMSVCLCTYLSVSLSAVRVCLCVCVWVGVGSFTIVDGQTVTGDDAGNKLVVIITVLTVVVILTVHRHHRHIIIISNSRCRTCHISHNDSTLSLRQKYGIPYRLAFCSLKHSLHLDVIWRPTTFSQPTLPPSVHPQCALILFWDFGTI